MNANTTDSQPSLADRLRSVHVGVRQDLDVSRHVFRGEPSYIVRDPITFQSHQLSPEDYQVLVSIDHTRTLGETFAMLCERDTVDQGGEEKFYQFVFALHRLGFLNLPISDEKLLYRRYRARQQARRRQKLMGFLFLQIPLVKPDAFLARTLPAVRWIFTRWFFLVWLTLVGCAGYVIATRWDEMVQPVHGLLATRNLGLMWLTLIVLKICHEMGHAYTCKHFGGHVPEMGAYLIAFTPCAYVDATAAWGFTRKRERLYVSLAGVYVETTIAALAVFVWALTGPSLLNAMAYNVIFLASAVTLLFNINPLMRYDGYYVASDLLEIPNLRARATRHMLGLARRWLLGVRSTVEPVGLRLWTILTAFGVASTCYRTLVLVGIAAVVATKFPVLGFGLAGFFIGTTLLSIVRRLTRYLWFAEETAPVRVRAVALSGLLLVVIPSAIGLVPLPARVHAAGSVTAENETVVRAAVPGFVQTVANEPGEAVRCGAPMVNLVDLATEEQVAQARAELDACKVRRLAQEASDPAAAQEEAQRAASLRAALRHSLAELDDLSVEAPVGGRIVSGLRPTDTGRFVRPGDALATIVSGKWLVRAILTTDEFTAAHPSVGDKVEFRAAGATDTTLMGTIARITPAGSRHVDIESLTHVAGGDVVIEPATGEATQPYFELVVTLDDPDSRLAYGMTGVVQLPATPEPLGLRVYRRVARFANRLRES